MPSSRLVLLMLCKHSIIQTFLLFAWTIWWIFNPIWTWNSPCISLNQLSFGCYAFGLMVFHIWFSSIFETFLTLKTQLMFFCNYSKWTPMLLQIISQGPLFQLLVLQGFWHLAKLLEAFGQLWWVRSYID